MRLRVLDLDHQPPYRSQAVYHGIAAALTAGDDPVLTLLSPSDPYVCVGLHQDIALEVDEAYCQEQGLPVIRRRVGGGAVYLDRHQLFFHFIYPAEHAPRRISEIYGHFTDPVIETYRRLGVDAHFRPVNDIQVNGRKIGGTGAATLGEATVMVGSFLFDFDVDTMSRCLKVPSEKFRDKLRQGMDDYITTLTRELGHPPSREEVIATFLQALRDRLGVEPVADNPTPAEEAAIAQQERALADPDWTHQKGRRFVEGGVKIAEGTHLADGAEKAPGGLVRARLLSRDGRVADLSLSGDFTVFPQTGMERVAQALRGLPLDPEGLEVAISRAMQREEMDLPGVDPRHIATAILNARRG
ncbi:lipoate-protein ligase A [Ectothiorhodospira mobilis]|uniref:Lipoate-protein ligase A n=1 Tax=Ectothiorhodospira mobilis TaxID=195064 RepID=A0A1I4S0F3_ECTMO|nr:lipoate--protein ligase [Ectothiorhodospira mobilis]SFM57704.1 lipoate-protein ligase A [Ectothiorhodospira mobilis]